MSSRVGEVKGKSLFVWDNINCMLILLKLGDEYILPSLFS